MRKIIGKVAMVAMMIFLTSWALAGLVQPAEVLVTLNPDGSGSAQGDMLTARYSDNDVEFIGCGIRKFDDGLGFPFTFGFCQATDANETMAFCSSLNPDLLDAMSASSDYSFVTFSFNTVAECTRIGFSTQSFYIPSKVHKKPKKAKGD